MNRQILFKAKRKDNGEWIQGYYYQIWQQGYILWGMINNMPDMVEVNPDTLCQCTGLTDERGQKIWENDILVEKHKGIVTVKYRVVFDLEEGAWMLETKSGARYKIGVVNQRDFEVCGNIFDNPELLEVDR